MFGVLLSLMETGGSAPWWITAITGSGGALIIQQLWIRSLTASLQKKEAELMEISKESIECITKILERHDQDRTWRDKVLETLLSMKNKIDNIKDKE